MTTNQIIDKKIDSADFENIKPYEHQILISKEGYKILKNEGFVYLCMEERTGKTLTSLLILNQCKNIKNVLIITKKKIVPEWEFWIHYFKNYLGKDGKNKDVKFTIINYEAIHKIEIKLYSIVILDESHHCLSGYPRPNKTYINLKKIIYVSPIICLSATPSSQSYSQLYHQLSLTHYQPFYTFKNFYEWFKMYGEVEMVRIGARTIQKYDKITNIKAINDIRKRYFVSYTRKELNFKQEPQDVIHYIDMPTNLKELIKISQATKCVPINPKNSDCKIYLEVPLNNIPKEATIIHQLEGGTIKVQSDHFENDYNFYFLNELPKIEYIKQKWGDVKDIAIFYNYIAEGILLNKHFKNALILQGTTYAEGIDLSHLKICIIYSMNYSAAKYIQRRARMCNIKRDRPIENHFLLFKGYLSDFIYKTVAVGKKNFTASYYEHLKHFE